MKLKKIFTVLMTAVLMAGMLTACGSDQGDSSSGKTSITIFNSKTELQEDLEKAAAEYGEKNDVNIEVYYSNDTVAAHLASKYASKEPYTINMVDAKDVYSLGAQYGYDMSDQEWVSDTDYAISVDDKVIGFPVCIEARGMLFNKHAIEETLGEKFDPSTIKTLDDFEAICEKLVKNGMEHPTAILKPDWSLAAHYLQQMYEERDNVDEFVDELYAGKVDVSKDEKFNALMDTFDVLMKYNLFGDAPISVEDEQVHRAMAEGQVAFQFGGCWEWNDIIDFDYTGDVGLMPVPQNIEDDYTGKIVGGGSKYFYIDNSEYTTEEQQKAAEEFLQWFASSDEGKKLVSDTCAMVSPFKSNDVECSNELGVYVKQYVDEGKLVPNYDYDPDDHYSVLGTKMQEYLAGKMDRTKLAQEIETYWSNAKPVKH